MTKFEKKQGDTFIPKGNKKCVIFVDDMNVPKM